MITIRNWYLDTPIKNKGFMHKKVGPILTEHRMGHDIWGEVSRLFVGTTDRTLKVSCPVFELTEGVKITLVATFT